MLVSILNRRQCEILFREAPDSPQVTNLHQTISARHNHAVKEENRDRAILAGLAGVGLTVAAVALGMLFSRKK
jgi:endonuclease III